MTAVHPLVATWHNAPVASRGRRLIHTVVERTAARGADATLAVSSDLVDRARRAGAQDVRFVPAVAPPLGPARRTAEEVRAELGVGTRPLVLAVARLSRQKRLDVLVRAAAQWGSGPRTPIVIVAGDGPEQARLVGAASRSRAPVRFLGRREDIADLLGAADVVALPSAWEARPFVAQEALRAGVPLVATAVGGVADLVGDAALLVPPGDEEALRIALERVLGDDALREALVARGRTRCAVWPSVDDMIEIVESVYREVIARR
jgi:glycosyltransferase involved in cell wall biosynthesis